jgi:glycosyltransferase involved in cell wall biosynthesis
LIDLEIKMSVKSNFKIVVLLPVMNEAKWINRCLTSLVHQSQEDIAILIQENCSDDGSVEIISKFENNFPNIFIFKNSSRVNSWENWDLLLNNAVDKFNFEYLFWIGGDDYLIEVDFFRDLYKKGKEHQLQIVSPTINLVNGESGEFKETIQIEFKSGIKLKRVLNFCNDWRNVNIFHSLISKELYLELLDVSGNSHTDYIGNDWWLGLSMIRKNQVTSLESCHFSKSVWPVRRYEWISNTDPNFQHIIPSNRVTKFLEHIFQDAITLRKHGFGSHPLKYALTKLERSVVLFVFFARAIYMPIVHLIRYVFFQD